MCLVREITKECGGNVDKISSFYIAKRPENLQYYYTVNNEVVLLTSLDYKSYDRIKQTTNYVTSTSRENNGYLYTTNITLTIPKILADKNGILDELKNMDLAIFLVDRNNNPWYFGLEVPVKVTEISLSSDNAGYIVNFVSTSKRSTPKVDLGFSIGSFSDGFSIGFNI